MPYKVNHLLAQLSGTTSIRTSDGLARARFSASGPLPVRFPGKLQIGASARYFVKIRVDDPEGGPSRTETQSKTLPLTVTIKTPDGQAFSADQVSLGDIRRFRDLRGVSQGSWSYHVSGESEPVPVEDGDVQLVRDRAHVRIALEETVGSQSAPPLVHSVVAAGQAGRFEFDLYRVGTFTATARGRGLPVLGRRRLRLRDPDDTIVAESGSGRLDFPVDLPTLERSRDRERRPRLWSLEVDPSTSPLNPGQTTVQATVIQTARIRTEALKRRIVELIGERGEKLEIFGDMQGQRLRARLRILDAFSAETIDVHGLLDSLIESEPQDPGVSKDIQVGTAYTLASRDRTVSGDFRLSLNDVKLQAIHIDIGPSQNIEPSIPALKIRLETQGSVTVKLGGFPLATCKIRDNRIDMETGLRLNPEGTFSVVSWLEEDRVDVDVHWAAAVAAGVVSAGLLALGAAGVAELLEGELNSRLSDISKTVFTSGLSQVPRILAMILGDDFTYRSLRIEEGAVVFDYVAPLEPEPKPAANYKGIIGRSATQLGPDAWLIRPPTLGDTWAAQNLAQKIDHIVLIIMENRSFDHVLGYIAATAGNGSSNGLSAELTDFLATQGFPVKPLRDAGFTANGVGLKTKLPSGVGHSFADVAEQLSEQTSLPSGRGINSPSGFLSNFARRAQSAAERGVKPEDVLGFYDAGDLPFFKFLTDNYAWCETFYCSHPGPTLPNRMLSLTGDLQYDRTLEAIIENNNSDNFFLSRALSIFDVLTRKGISWRVYESFPSVAMLRMFARYSTDTTQIVDVSRLAQDVVQGNLPALTVIEPAMHHAPANDDHPPADMYRGQLFLKHVYDTLRSNDALWRKTLLIITYDEHGGLYDHVFPPIADVRTRPMVATEDPEGASGGGHFTPDTVITRYGVRVPTFVVSPWVRAGKGPDLVMDFCSILKTVLARFCGQDRPFLSDRVEASQSFESYLTAAEPRLDVPASPDLAPLPPDEPLLAGPLIQTAPLSRKQMRSGNVDYHDLTGMLARLLGRNSPDPIA